jgi:hypothetical protein
MVKRSRISRDFLNLIQIGSGLASHTRSADAAFRSPFGVVGIPQSRQNSLTAEPACSCLSDGFLRFPAVGLSRHEGNHSNDQ